MRFHRTGTFATCLLLASGCSSQPPGARARANLTPDAGASAPPALASQHPPCLVSADCPSGEHCDLSQCVQDCNAADPCTGQLTCSPRARCLSTGTADADPVPTGKSLGTVSASPSSVALTDRQSSFSIALTSTSAKPVRYRVEVSGPHLSVAQPRGSFTGSTALTIAVKTSGLLARNVPGTVTVYTDLGTVIVSAPIHVGVTGSYKGTMVYDGGTINLGETHLALDVLEQSGAVKMRVVSDESLLFPATTAGEATGLGMYTVSSGVDATVAQVLDAGFGGSTNAFGRPIGRQTRFLLAPDSLGNLSGTFTETIVGLFAGPITTSGHVSLQAIAAGADPVFTVASTPAMPASPSKSTAADLTTLLGLAQPAYCDPTWDPTNLRTWMSWATATFGTELPNLFAQPSSSATFFKDVSAACTEAMAKTSFDAYQASTTDQTCDLPQALANYAQCGAVALNASNVTDATAIGGLVQEALAAPLLVGKNDIVQGLHDSFASGLSAEQTQNGKAIAALAPYAAWVSQPALLEFLRSMPAAAARGSSSSQPYPTALAMADLFSTLASVEGETARINADSGEDLGATKTAAQQRAVLTYLESAAFQEILTAWGTVPASVGATFTGVLTPLDRGYVSMLEGANVFGVPGGFVPFVFDPASASKGATNFEQVDAMAQNDVANESAIEMQFTSNERAYDTAQTQLDSELQNVGVQYDSQIKDICGAGFDPSTASPDWTTCGAGDAGTLGIAVQGIAVAQAKVASAQAHVEGDATKVTIDIDTLAQEQSLDAAQIQFTQNNGAALGALDFVSGMLTAAEQSIQVASSASLFNLGAPLAEAVPTLLLGAEQAAVSSERDNLQTAQTVNTEQTQMTKEYLDATANIKKETIDVAQASVDATSSTIEVIQAETNAQNLRDQAKEAWSNRQAALNVINQDKTKDPSYRLLRDKQAVQVLAARSEAQSSLYLAASALQYEINDESIANLPGAVLNAQNAVNLASLQSCLTHIFDAAHVAYGAPQDYVTTVSVRQMLGIMGPRKDAVTGKTLSEGEQFRELLLKNGNLDGRGGVGITFSTDLKPGNGLWADDVCDDRVVSVQAQLVGDFLGDNQAQVNLSVGGVGVLRACDSDSLTTWSFGGASAGAPIATAVIQAGINAFGTATANTSLFGQPVARANWTLTIPSGQDAPSNADVDLTHVDDVVLNIDHKALARHTSPVAVDLSCLANVGQ